MDGFDRNADIGVGEYANEVAAKGIIACTIDGVNSIVAAVRLVAVARHTAFGVGDGFDAAKAGVGVAHLAV